MTQMKGNPVHVWDPPYYTLEARKSLFKTSRADFLPYFSLGACMEGLNLLTQNLYNIELVQDEILPGEVWNGDVYKLSVIHGTEGKLGEVFCDFYEREGKPHQDCHFTIQGGKELASGEYQNPIVVLMLNFPAPSGSSPSLLSPSMVDNLFHEMGHALHSMMARTKYQHVTGTRCTTDFAEVPSILMEYFASDPRVVATFARHYKTGEPMPQELIMKYSMAKHVFAASDMQMQNFYAALDQSLHTSSFPLEKSTMDILEQVHSKFYGLPYVQNTAWHLRFGHLVGYGSKYFSYLIARAISSWIWQEYFQADPFNSTNGDRYRREVLAHGGGVPAKQLVSNFLGKAITSDNLSQALINDLDENEKRLEWFLKKTV
jgi:intermediate peptidase